MNRVFPRRGFGPAGGATDAADETVSGMMDMEYVYTAGANNRRISSSVDHVVNETVNYTYDSLNRLTQAVTAGSGGWGQGFSYDGFGNLTGKTAVKGTVPVLSVMFDGTTNRQVGQSYDANGNPATGGYDVENRMTNWGQIAYDHAGKRVFQATGAGEYYVYGIGGQKLMTRTCVDPGSGVVCTDAYNVYFGGKLVKSKGVTVVTDRLGSVRANGNGERFAYYPYGEERGTSAEGREKFGTYTRDSSGLDYADQRYYGVGTGRFGTPDPIHSADFGDPGSWNQYGYVGGDPLNFADPGGTNRLACDQYTLEGTCVGQSTGGGGFGWISFFVWSPEGLMPFATEWEGPPNSPTDPQGGEAKQPTPRYPGQVKARNLLADPNCARAVGGANATVQAAQDKLDKVAFGYGTTANYGGLGPSANLGQLVANVGPDGTSLAAGTGVPAIDYTQNGVDYIVLNGNVNWLDPNNSVARIAGTTDYTRFPLAAATAVDMNIGISNMTADQFDALVVLHELSHLMGAPQETSNRGAFNANIFQNCFH